uniref:Uncharacterized protein n=1 Tax=Utricularia reniformis TaxID=192314 RepID=A0A1Y0B004_9LAMI|nr:hypothetical protein AEK19_MT0510 [Utricularia reniformis]ART30766.1 hypothetical protein AEK19_MT0510 [Utricularia reniformis]
MTVFSSRITPRVLPTLFKTSSDKLDFSPFGDRDSAETTNSKQWNCET